MLSPSPTIEERYSAFGRAGPNVKKEEKFIIAFRLAKGIQKWTNI
jgi:hypothetical protein